ncbi:MAG: PAS domain-containing protein, partial [Firmicutes bacterium]|nr:PAS domain-containing protein [Bacillota bacterium]
MYESALLKISYQNILLHERAYLLTGNKDEHYNINYYVDLFVQHHSKLSSLTKGTEAQQRKLQELMQIFLTMYNKNIEPMLQMRSLMETSPEEFVRGFQFTETFNLSEAYTSEQLAILDSIEQNAQQQLAEQQKSMEQWYYYDTVLTIAGPMIVLLVTFLTGLLAVLKIASYRKKQEAYQKQLKNSRDQYSNVIEGANVGTWIWHVQEETISVNEKWAGMLGYTLAELQPISFKTWDGNVHPDDYALSQQMIQDIVSGTKKSFSFDVRLRCKDGSWTWIHDQGKVISWSDDGKPLLMTGTHTNINKRKEAQFALEKSEQDSRRLIDSMAQGFAHCEVILDERGIPSDIRFIKANPSFEHYMEVPREYLVGKTLRSVMPEVEEYWIERNCEVALTGKPTSFEGYNKVLDKYF